MLLSCRKPPAQPSLTMAPSKPITVGTKTTSTTRRPTGSRARPDPCTARQARGDTGFDTTTVSLLSGFLAQQQRTAKTTLVQQSPSIVGPTRHRSPAPRSATREGPLGSISLAPEQPEGLQTQRNDSPNHAGVAETGASNSGSRSRSYPYEHRSPFPMALTDAGGHISKRARKGGVVDARSLSPAIPQGADNARPIGSHHHRESRSSTDTPSQGREFGAPFVATSSLGGLYDGSFWTPKRPLDLVVPIVVTHPTCVFRPPRRTCNCPRSRFRRVCRGQPRVSPSSSTRTTLHPSRRH